MQFWFLSILVVFAANVVARPDFLNHVVHEKRNRPSSWTSKGNAKPDGRVRLPVRIGLKERNIDSGDQILMNIADPASNDYAKHMTPKQVHNRGTTFIEHS